LNAVVFSLGWNSSSNGIKKNPYLPPGYIIGSVWVVILGVLGALYYHTRSVAVVGLIVFCLLYPFLTAGLRMNTLSAVLNLVTLVFAFVVTIIIPRVYIMYMVPILVWTGYVNVTQLLV
jgi:hypothetical protein